MANFFVESDSSSSNFIIVPPGSHVARCYRIVDLGTQKTEYLGQIKHLRKVMFGWELHGDDNEGKPLLTDKGEPMAIFKNYTLSLNEKANLRLDLQSWRGKNFTDAEASRFDIAVVLGQWCMLNVIHRPGKEDKIFANVGGVSPIPQIVKQHGLPKGINELQMFRLADPDMEVFETFSKGLKAKIESSPEWKGMMSSKAPSKAPPSPPQAPAKGGFDDMDDDIPF
jgi:hypothetical protein